MKYIVISDDNYKDNSLLDTFYALATSIKKAKETKENLETSAQKSVDELASIDIHINKNKYSIYKLVKVDN